MTNSFDATIQCPAPDKGAALLSCADFHESAGDSYSFAAMDETDHSKAEAYKEESDQHYLWAKAIREDVARLASELMKCRHELERLKDIVGEADIISIDTVLR